MPSLVESLREIIAPEFHQPLDNEHLVLQEKGQQDCRLWVSDCEHFAMNIDVDKKDGKRDSVLPFLDDRIRNLTKKCDLILFVPEGERGLLVFLIEMKSKNTTAYLLQLRASREFARFLLALLRLHRGETIAPPLAGWVVEYRGVLISNAPPPKGTTRPNTKVQFEMRNDLEVCECHRSTPPMLSALIKASK